MPKAWLIVGCGYVGERLARKLIAGGHLVSATRREPEDCAALQARVRGLRVQPYRLGDATMALPREGVVVIAAPPGERAPAAESVFAGRLGPRIRLIYLSTTGVFADAHGAIVDDEFPTGPSSERGERRLAVETALKAVQGDHVSLRIPGIYGPHRGVHARMQAGNYRIIGDGESVISRIHVDDLVSAIMLLGRRPELAHQTYVVGDELPCSSLEHALGVAARLGLPPPPHLDPSEVSADVRAMLGAGRRILPRRLKELGWKAQYPTWREGLEQALAEEQS